MTSFLMEESWERKKEVRLFKKKKRIIGGLSTINWVCLSTFYLFRCSDVKYNFLSSPQTEVLMDLLPSWISIQEDFICYWLITTLNKSNKVNIQYPDVALIFPHIGPWTTYSHILIMFLTNSVCLIVLINHLRQRNRQLEDWETVQCRIKKCTIWMW